MSTVKELKETLHFIAENRLGFRYLYRDTTFGAYGDDPTHIIITQTQGRECEDIAKYEYNGDEDAIENAIDNFKKEHVVNAS